MIQHRDAQQKAQAELDKVIGRTRLPELEDRESLPYINAICKETFRVHTVVPLGLPHGSIEDDYYRGMYVPKGSMMLTNVW